MMDEKHTQPIVRSSRQPSFKVKRHQNQSLREPDEFNSIH
jgi:hypothetical protein